jgi:hypothetical protein
MSAVTRAIATELRGPILAARLGYPHVATTLMQVPKAPVYEYCDLQASEDNVWFAGQIGSVQAIAQASRMKHPSDQQLRSRIDRADATHDCATDAR